MGQEITDFQHSLLVRLSFLCVRANLSRDRHYAGAEKFKKLKSRLTLFLIIVTSIMSVGIISVLSGESLRIILNNDVLFVKINFLQR